jgi:hypothetical protein
VPGVWRGAPPSASHAPAGEPGVGAADLPPRGLPRRCGRSPRRRAADARWDRRTRRPSPHAVRRGNGEGTERERSWRVRAWRQGRNARGAVPTARDRRVRLGGSRAGAARARVRRCVRIRSMTAGSVRKARIRMAPPQRGQTSGSTSKIRRNNSAHRRRASLVPFGAGATRAPRPPRAIPPAAHVPHSPRARGAESPASDWRTSRSSASAPDAGRGCGSRAGRGTPVRRASHGRPSAPRSCPSDR